MMFYSFPRGFCESLPYTSIFHFDDRTFIEARAKEVQRFLRALEDGGDTRVLGGGSSPGPRRTGIEGRIAIQISEEARPPRRPLRKERDRRRRRREETRRENVA